MAGVVAGGFTLGALFVVPGLRGEDGGIERARAAAAAEPQPPAISAPMSSANAG
jgi:hypothetical protein